ncbi:MAG: protein translocase subunit SecD [Parachlamydiales bacterium]|jgi:SecD/SecF fusion protein
MEKQKKWQFWLIVAVIVLTIYNILPTIFYYTKPLHETIDAARAKNVAGAVVSRVNGLEEDSKEWLESYSALLKVKPVSIELQKNDPRLYKMVFATEKEANTFKRYLPEAGKLIPFTPAQLGVNASLAGQLPTEVYVSRQISVELNPADIDQLFIFSKKTGDDGLPTPLYREIVYDRAAQVAFAFSQPSRLADMIASITEAAPDKVSDETIILSARELVDGSKLSKPLPAISQRWMSSVAQGKNQQGAKVVQKYQQALDTLQAKLKAKIDAAKTHQSKQIEEGEFATGSEHEDVALLQNQFDVLTQAMSLLKANKVAFDKAQKPLSRSDIIKQLNEGASKITLANPQQVIDLKGTDPFIKALIIDWNSDKLSVKFYPDIETIRTRTSQTEAQAYVAEKLNQWIFDDIARASNISDEDILPNGDTFAVRLNSLTDSKSLLSFDLGAIAQIRSKQILDQLTTEWQPIHHDLEHQAYPLYAMSDYLKLPDNQKRLGVVVYAPSMYGIPPVEGFASDSIYIIAKGLGTILDKYRNTPTAEGADQFNADVRHLSQILSQNGFIGFPGDTFGVDPQFRNDYIFKMGDYYGDLVSATRENFVAKGSKKYAVLDFTDVEQRILTENRIDDKKQEDLLKWYEEYQAAQGDLDITKRYLIPEPTKNPYIQNFLISAQKYFRGDDRKILKWGLDLSGGKTVRIGLRDSSNKPVTNPDDLKQAADDLYTRVNKMGVAERTIRVESNNIVLDFPGSQGLSASELVKASAMYFHIVNEKFNSKNRENGTAVRQFLDGVWNEAKVTNRLDAESINQIAYRHLGESIGDDLAIQPRSEAAQSLYNNGLRLADPMTAKPSNAFNDTLSSIGMMRDDAHWDGESNPLIIIFHNYALEGANLTNVNVGWDQSEGNILTFSIKNSYGKNSENKTGSPSEDFYTWTSEFAEDRISGTPKEAYTNGKGWRMAVALNGNIITTPSLRQALRENASITGRFTQREINRLAADLKAGSLKFTPRILSEENVSPELGKEERTKGIRASIIALVLVVISMVSIYRFGGVVASCAVLFNILIMWGVLQNLDAALTLPGIAGIVLTIGMAIDANVLVFERVREEFKMSGRIASAIQAGYRKAFSAIFDSNITTIIVALILIQFDSGPIKGFAVTLIIGILSSMFTALFMTRYFFAGWVQNPKHKELHMVELISGTKFDFLAQTRKAILLSALVVALGIGLFAEQRNTIFGMDFTGGYSLIVNAQEQPGDVNYRLQALDSLLAQGATTNDLQVRQLTNPWQLRIQMGISMEESGHPFYQMPMEIEGKFTYPYQSNPRIDWVVNSLQKGGLTIPESELAQLDRQWTVMSGQFSDSMRYNAIIGLALAFLAILAYITLRFEFKFAVAAVIGLVHDVIITLGIIALFHKLGLPVQIDLITIGAIMMIIGYSLNDTIIIFDRIREDVGIMRKSSFPDIINHALNVTLTRTLMTSGTTILVLLALVIFGGEAIFSFALVMTIGIVVGTLSSLFVAAPVMLYLHNREERSQQAALNHRKV